MSIIQALLLGLFGWISSIYSPVLMGGLGGWYTLGRPLVSGLVIGIIMGDVSTGIILGGAIQCCILGWLPQVVLCRQMLILLHG